MSKPKPEIATLQTALVDLLISAGRISTQAVAQAFLNVPRHIFVPDAELQTVYSDVVIATKADEEGYAISSSSQPSIMALMLEQLRLEPGMRVLEIGAGTGYNAALMAHIIGETGVVVTVDIEEDLVMKARQHLKTAAVTNVKVIHADGYHGYIDLAPYDRVILTVSPWDISPNWIRQLKPDGRLVAPLTLTTTQASIAFEKDDIGLHSVHAVWCGFMPLRGRYAAPKTVLTHTLFENVALQADERFNIPIEDVKNCLQEPFTDHLIGTDLPALSGFDEWLALFERNTFRLVTQDKQAGQWPFMNGVTGHWTAANGLATMYGLGVLCRPMDTLLSEEADFSTALPLVIRLYGSDRAPLVRLESHLRNWQAAGQPDVTTMHYQLIPLEQPYEPHPGEITIEKQWHRLIVRWQN